MVDKCYFLFQNNGIMVFETLDFWAPSELMAGCYEASFCCLQMPGGRDNICCQMPGPLGLILYKMPGVCKLICPKYFASSAYIMCAC